MSKCSPGAVIYDNNLICVDEIQVFTRHDFDEVGSDPAAGIKWAAELHRQWLDAWEQYERRSGKRVRAGGDVGDGGARRLRQCL